MRRFEFCLQLKWDLMSFTNVIKYSETGHDAYQEIIAEQLQKIMKTDEV